MQEAIQKQKDRIRGRTTIIKDFIENCKDAGIGIDRFADFSPMLMMQYLLKNHKNINEIIVIRKYD